MLLHDYKAMFLLCGYRPETLRQHSYVGFVATYLLPGIVAMHQPGFMDMWLCRYETINVGMWLHTYYTFYLLPCSHCFRVLYKEGGNSLSLNTF